MKLARAILIVSMLAVAGPVLPASARELDAAELRQISRTGGTISLKRVIDSVSKSTGGTPIEARAFEIDGVFYRIVLKKANGALVSIIINARTGAQVGKNSAIGKLIASEAEAGAKGKSNKDKGKSASAGSKAGGNSGGNSGGGGNGGGGNGGGGGGGGGGKN